MRFAPQSVRGVVVKLPGHRPELLEELQMTRERFSRLMVPNVATYYLRSHCIANCPGKAPHLQDAPTPQLSGRARTHSKDDVNRDELKFAYSTSNRLSRRKRTGRREERAR